MKKDLGVCLLDIGGGTTDIAIFTHGAIRHTAVVPIAGDQITNDIAMALRTPTADAEANQGAPRRRAAAARRPEPDARRAGHRRARRALAVATDACRGDRAAVEELYSLVQQVLPRGRASRSFYPAAWC